MRGSERIQSGMTRKFAVLGYPISHSKSPLIHTAAFSFLGVDSKYEAIELNGGLKTFLENCDLEGLSLTMPLKEEALDVSTRADSLAIATNAANTLIRSETGWDAYNTDVFGIQEALRSVAAKRAAILGTGATARSAIVAMQELGKEVAVWGRDEFKTKRLANEFSISTLPKFHKAAEYPLVISSLPARALDSHLDSIMSSPKGTLLDVAYDPWPSEAAKLWSKAGKVVSGLEMLVFQAVAQQRLFAGNDLDEPLNNETGMVRAIHAALKMAN